MNINVADLIGEVKGMDEEDLIISEAMDAETLDDIIEEVKDRPSVAYQTDILFHSSNSFEKCTHQYSRKPRIGYRP